MERTDRVQVRDPRAGAVLANRWTLETPEHQGAAAEAALSSMPAAPGLLRYSVFRGLEDLTLFHLSQWTDEAARDAYLQVSHVPRAAFDVTVPDVRRDWREPARPYRSFVAGDGGETGCLVLVRQPLKEPDPAVQRDWVDTVLRALELEPEGTPGLCAATFFLSADGGLVLNLAEWTSAEAHRDALRHGSLGESPEWWATRSHPGIRAEHDVRRYRLVGAVERGG